MASPAPSSAALRGSTGTTSPVLEIPTMYPVSPMKDLFGGSAGPALMVLVVVVALTIVGMGAIICTRLSNPRRRHALPMQAHESPMYQLDEPRMYDLRIQLLQYDKDTRWKHTMPLSGSSRISGATLGSRPCSSRVQPVYNKPSTSLASYTSSSSTILTPGGTAQHIPDPLCPGPLEVAVLIAMPQHSTSYTPLPEEMSIGLSTLRVTEQRPMFQRLVSGSFLGLKS
ncbi:hypothetical protein BC835DRAFT_1422880 [Cytidiella melzeri]|nr:hypothetical protein BC835DRAFT_1422880 [Cytidiella melzeri]